MGFSYRVLVLCLCGMVIWFVFVIWTLFVCHVGGFEHFADPFGCWKRTVTAKPVIMNRFMSSASVHPGFSVLYVCWREYSFSLFVDIEYFCVLIGTSLCSVLMVEGFLFKRFLPIVAFFLSPLFAEVFSLLFVNARWIRWLGLTRRGLW